MYQFEFADFSSTLISSCHYSAVTDIVFPQSVPCNRIAFLFLGYPFLATYVRSRMCLKAEHAWERGYQPTKTTCQTTYISCLHTHICFPSLSKSSELFATSSRNNVCVWHTVTGKELLRLVVPNLTCHAVDITPDGGAIITGADMFCCCLIWSLCIFCKCEILLRSDVIPLAWDDGKIRAFYPESGKPMYTIHDAHNKVCVVWINAPLVPLL